MVIKAQIEAEPIPGYRLIARLGQGGFGEVWKAEAPGGLMKAIKFVHGTLNSAVQDDGGGVHQELKSLNRVKSVRHPYILSLERYDIIEGQLLIVMELADKNLWDRLKEYHAQGQPGIPREELLGYMEEAAEALDLMNIQYGLQHLDIKPQNLFLIHNHVKVADFGLVKDLEGMNTQVTGGVTPIYAAPETFEGTISRYCDQYNLSIVYQELLTSQRPYNGTTARALLMQHMTGTPDLSSLPECDRPVIARALSKKPEDRYPSCTDMVQALRQAGSQAPGSEPKRLPRPVITPETPPSARASYTPTPTPVLAKSAPKPPKQERPEITGDGILFPALLVGAGKTGLKVLQQLRLSLYEQWNSSALWPHLRFLFIDTDPETVEKANQITIDAQLEDSALLLARLNRPSYYLKPTRNRAALESWLNYGMICRVPRNQSTTEGLRILGRLGFFENYRTIQDALRAGIEACGEPAALQSADRQTRLGMRSNRPRVYVICSLGGGTGSGMFIDLAYAARAQLHELGYKNAEVIGVFMLPPASVRNRQNPGLVNTYAALTELNHFSTPTETYSGYFDDGEGPVSSSEPPFNRCIMLPLPEEQPDTAPFREATARAGDYLCRELMSALGRETEAARNEVPPPEVAGLMCQTFGSYRFFVPRRPLKRRASRAVLRQLLHSWLDTQRPGLKKTVRTRIDEMCTRLHLEPDTLIESLQESCKQTLNEDPEVLFAKIIGRYLSKEGNFDIDTAEQTLDDLDQLLGRPAEDGSDEVQGPMVEALDAAARKLQVEWEQKLHQVVHGLIDDPKYRIAGAEEAIQQVVAMLRELIGTHTSLGEEISARAEEAHLSIGELVSSLQKGSWWPGRMTKMTADLRQSFTLYAKLRYQTLLLESVLDVFEDLVKKLPKRLEEIGFCRQRMTQIYETVDDARRKLEIGVGRAFLPAGVASAEEALESLVGSIRAEDILEIDNKIQAAVRRQFKSLVAACLGDDAKLAELIHVLRDEATAWIDEQLGKESVAERYLELMPSETELTADLTAVLGQAAPELGGARSSPESELSYVVVPNDPAGEQLGRLAQTCAMDLRVLRDANSLDVFFYRERPQLPLADLPQLGLMVEEAYRQMTAAGHFSPHTRNDVREWRPPHE